jgi:hypothetical protein
MTEIVNRVAQSQIKTINLEEIYPKEERVVFDLAPFLFQELVLREKEFRKALKEINWMDYSNKWVAIICTADAIIPNWAFMLVATYLTDVSKGYAIGNLTELEIMIADQLIGRLDPEDFAGRPVVVKGCSVYPVPLFAYGRIIAQIQSQAKSIMYGEPCSTVPLFKKQSS